MRIQKLTLVNFRSYKNAVSIEDLSDVNVFVGPNIAGKSNVLEALQYFKGLTIGGGVKDFSDMVFDRNSNLDIQMMMTIALSPDERNEMLKRLFRTKRNIAIDEVTKSSFLSTLSLEVVIRPSGVVAWEIKGSKPVNGDFTLYKAELMKEKLRRSRSVLDLDSHCNSITAFDDQSFTNPSLRDPGAQDVTFVAFDASNLGGTLGELINKLQKFFRNSVLYPPIRQVTPRIQLGEEKTLLPTGTNLVKFLNSLLSNDPDRFVALKDKTAQIIPLIKAILAPARGNEATVDIREEGLETPTNISNVSFGLTQILVLAIGFITAPEGSLIMIEEPELHLHAGSQRRLFELIQNEAKNKQFFITTHSSIFTGCSDKVKTYLVTKKKGVSSVRSIQEKAELRLVKTELGHRNIDLFGYECVIFVEGDSEEKSIPIIAEQMGYDFVERGVKLINVGGSGKATKIEEYLRYLKDSGVLAYVITDGSKEVSKKIEDWRREDLLKEELSTVWSLEFEDCFDPETLSKAIEEYAKELSIDFTVKIDELRKTKTEGKSVSKLIQKLLHDKGFPELKKPLLAEKIALVLTEEMKDANHQETPVEREIKKIISLIEARY